MERKRNCTRMPRNMRYIYKRITAFILVFVMVFSNIGNNAYLAYGAVVKEKVKVHAQISTKAIIDTLIATGGTGIDFDDEIGDLLLTQSQAENSSIAVYDELMEELAKEDRHLIAQRKVGGLGLFLIAENETEDTIYPDTVDLEEDTVSEMVFKLYSKGKLIEKDDIIDDFEDEEEDSDEDLQDELTDDVFGGTADERQTVANSIKHIILVAVNLADDVTYDITTSLIDDSLTVVKAELLTSVYKKKKETDKKELPGANAVNGIKPIPETSTEISTEETAENPTELSSEASTEEGAKETIDIETGAAAETLPEESVEEEAEATTEAESKASTESSTEAEKEAAAESSTEEKTEAAAGSSKEEKTEAATGSSKEKKTEAAAGSSKEEKTEAATESSKEEKTEAPAEAPVEEVEEDSVEVSIEKVDAPILQMALDTNSEDNKPETESSVTVIKDETTAAPETMAVTETTGAEEKITVSETSAAEKGITTAPEASEAQEETTTAPETSEAKEETSAAVKETTTVPETSMAGKETTEAVEITDEEKETTIDDETSDEDTEEDEYTVKRNKTKLKKADIESLTTTNSKASSSEAKGGFKFTAKPYSFTMLTMDMEAGEVEAKLGTLRIENTTGEENDVPVTYSIKLSNDESEEPVYFDGLANIYSMEENGDVFISEFEIQEGELYLESGQAAEIVNLSSDTKYEVEIQQATLPMLYSAALDSEEQESEDNSITFTNGEFLAVGIIKTGATLKAVSQNEGELLVSILDFSGKGIPDVEFKLYCSSDNKDQISANVVGEGSTNKDGQIALNYNSDGTIQYYYLCMIEKTAETIVAKYQKTADDKQTLRLVEKNNKINYTITTDEQNRKKPTITLRASQNEGNLLVTIQDSSGKGIPDVEFKLYRSLDGNDEKSNIVIDSNVTNNNGQISLDYNSIESIQYYYYLYIVEEASETIVAKYQRAGKLDPNAKRTLRLIEQNNKINYTITTANQGFTTPKINLKKKVDVVLNIKPVIQGVQTASTFSYTIKTTAGSPYMGMVRIDGEERQMPESGILSLEADQTASISSTERLVVTARSSGTYQIKRIVQNGKISGNVSVEFDPGAQIPLDVVYVYGENGSGKGGTAVTKKAFATDIPGKYNMELTVSGVSGYSAQDAMVDVVLVIDLSNSMNYTMGGDHQTAAPGQSRYDILKKSVLAMTSEILSSNTNGGFNNQVSVVGYSETAELLIGWTDQANDIKLPDKPKTNNTNCQAGFMEADDTLAQLGDDRKDSQKFVVYLSDGEPNRYFDESGSVKSDNEMARSSAIFAAKELRKNHPEATIMTLGVSTDPGTNVLAPSGDNKYWDTYAKVTTGDEFSGAFDTIAQIIRHEYKYPKVTDVLGDNVELIDQETNTFTTTHFNANTMVQPEIEGNAAYDNSSRAINWDVITTAASGNDKLKSFDDVYTLKYQVKVIDKFAQRDADEIGEQNTGTHSGEEGWWSNEYANLYCNDKTDFPVNIFPLPVVQTASTIGFDVLKVDQDNNQLGLQGANFTLYQKNQSNQWDEVSDGTTGKNGRFSFKGLLVGKVYKLVETDAPAGYEKSDTIYYVIGIAENGQAKIYLCNELGQIGSDAQEITEQNPLVVENAVQDVKLELQITKSIDHGDMLSPDDKKFNFRLAGPSGNYDGSIRLDNVLKSSDIIWTSPEPDLDHMKPGSYTLSELDNNSYFELEKVELEENTVGAILSDDKTVKFDLAAGDNTEATLKVGFTNRIHSKDITITKKVTVNDHPTSGVLADGTYYFALYNSDGSARIEGHEVKQIAIQNGKANTAVFTGVPIGSYKIYEGTLDADNNFIIGTPTDTDVTPSEGAAVTVTTTSKDLNVEFVNNKVVLGNVTLAKTDGNGKSLAGADFTLYKKNGDAYDTSETTVYKTDADGKLSILNLKFGDYTLTETKAPAGYELTNPAWSIEFTVGDKDGQQKYSFEVANNKIQGYAEITKRFSDEASLSETEKAELLKQVFIGVYDRETNEEIIKPQNLVDGRLTVGPLDEGRYYFKETASPDGYIVSSKTVPFEIVSSNTAANPVQVGPITNDKVSASVQFTKVDTTNNSPMPDVAFNLYKDGGSTPFATYNSGNDGVVKAEGLGTGTYYFEEITPAGYVENTVKYYFTISKDDHGKTVVLRKGSTAGETVSTVENTRKSGNVTAVKVDGITEKALAGAEFMLYAKKAESSSFAAKAAKFVKGLFSSDDGYEEYWTEPYVTGTDGILKIDGLPWNDYKLVETKAPQGYKRLDAPLTFTIDDAHLEISLGINGEIRNERQTGSVQLTKSGKNSVQLGGAVFELYRKAETTDENDVRIGGTYNTTEKGLITVSDLAWGTYYFVETKAPAGYLLPQGVDARTREFTINAGNANEQNIMVAQTLEMENKLIEGNLILKKLFDTKTVEAADISTEDLSNVTFDVYRQKGETPDVGNDLRVNSESLQLRNDGTLKYGPLAEGRYYVIETGAPEEYPVSSETYPFEITAENHTVDQTITVDNTLIKKSVGFTKVDLDGGAPIKGAIFNLYKVNEDGSGEIYKYNILTDKDGSVKVTGLGVGTYYFVEASNTGYDVPETMYYFTITRNTEDSSVLHNNSADGPVVEDSVIPNNRLTASVELTKQDAEDSDKRLEGAQFSLYRKVAGEGGDQPIADNLITGSDGTLSYGAADSGLTWGDYYFVETKAPEGYKLDSTPINFTIDRDTFINGNTRVEITVKNDRYYGAAFLTKQFKDTSGTIMDINSLSAEFDLYKKGEDRDQKINVNPLVTDKNGKITKSSLEAGSYYFVETKAPEGFGTELESDGSFKKYEFTITVPDNNEIVMVDAGVSVNQQKPGQVEVEKLDASHENREMAGVNFVLYKDGLIRDEQIIMLETNSEGKAVLSDLAWGKYYLKEVTPEGYVVNNQKYDFTISADQLYKRFTGSEAIKNTIIKGSVTLTKTDAETKAPLQGVKFDLYKGVYESGTKVNVNELVTNENGQIAVPDLEYGDYYFMESEAQTGYELLTTPVVFEIREDGSNLAVNEKNVRKTGSIEITKADSNNFERLTGAEFTLYSKANHKSTNGVAQLITSLFNGDDYYEYGKYIVTGDTLKIENLPWDEYYLAETKAPQGYELDSSTKYPFVIDADHLTGMLPATDNVITNTRQNGSITLTKTDAVEDSKKLAGAVFELYLVGEDGNSIKQEGTFVTGSDGTVTANGLAWGTYYFKEIQAPEGYDIPENPNSTSATIDASNANTKNEMVSQPATMADTRIRGAVELTKIFKDGDSTIEGPELLAALYADVRFSLYKETANENKPELISSNITLNETGKAIVGDLEFGSYYFVETESPSEYPINPAKHAFTISQSSSEAKPVVAAVQVDNAKVYSSAQIVKVDGNDGSRPIEGAVFGLYNAEDNSPISDIPSDEHGVVKASGLGVGVYYLQELSNTGYEVSAEKYFFEITKESSSEVTVHQGSLSGAPISQVINKRQEGSITITKKGSDTGNGLDGAKFALYTEEDRVNPVKELATVDGQVTFDGLAWGTYYVVETEAPFGYVLAEKAEDRTDKFIIDRANITLTKEIMNTRIKGSVTLTKQDAKDNQAILSGAEFSLYQEDGTLLSSGITTVNGKVTVPNINAGSYYFVETKAPVGYEIQMEDGQPKKYGFTINQASITASAVVTAINDRLPGSVVIFKIDSDTEEGLEGATFELRRVNSGLKSLLRKTEPVSQYMTDSNGRLEITGLEWGDYELQEVIAPEGYIITDETPIRFEIKADHLQHGGETGADKITFKNTRQTGSIQLVKKDQEGHAVEGAEFELYRQNTETAGNDAKITSSDSDNGNYITDNDGNITVTGLSWGTYYFKEVIAPSGYEIQSAVTASVTINAVTAAASKEKPLEIQASNTKVYGSVVLQKTGEDGEKLTGAEFDLYSYTKAADGGITNPVLQGHYEVSSEAGKEGSLTVTDLPYGDYYFQETKAPDGYNLSQAKKAFSITANGQTIELNFENTKIRADVRFQKIDGNGDESSGLNGAVFELYKKSTNDDILIGEYTSHTEAGESGIVTAEGLGAGEYYFTEKTPPAGYELNLQAKHEFEVTAGDNSTVITLDPVTNIRKNGSVKLTKYAANTNLTLGSAIYNLYQMSGLEPDITVDHLVAEGLVTDESGILIKGDLEWGNYYFIEQVAPTGYIKDDAPIHFTINAETDFSRAVDVRGDNVRVPGRLLLEKISSEDNTEKLAGVTFELKLQGDDTVVRNLTTDSEGKAEAENLAWGTYILTETKAAEGFLQWNEGGRTVTIDADHLEIYLTGDQAVTNTPIKGSVKVIKKDASDQKLLLEGAAFDIYRAADDTKVGDLRTGADGTAVINSLRYGNYYLIETEAPQGYELPDPNDAANRVPFTIKDHSSVVEVPVTDVRIPGSVTTVKTDENGYELEGAVFTLYSRTDHRNAGFRETFKAKLTGTYFEYGTYTTGQDGVVKFENLPWDEYYLEETKAPVGYERNSKQYEFVIDRDHLAVIAGEDGQIINTALTGSVKLTKRDVSDGGVLAGAVFELYRRAEAGDTKLEIGEEALTTGVDGTLTISGLTWGSYYFKETKAPAGYALNPGNAEFTVTRENVAQSIEVPLAVEVTDQTISVGVDKVDAATGESLEGADLKLYRMEDVEAGRPLENAEPITEWTSKKGTPRNIGELLSGGSGYVLIETKAPTGYTLTENLVFNVKTDGTVETDGVVTEDNIILVQDMKFVPGTLTLTAGKTLTGRAVKEGEFTFNLLDTQKNVVATAVNREDGSIVFQRDGFYTETGEYDYTIVEVNNGLSGVAYDNNEYAVHVSVAANNEGRLAAKVIYPEGSDEIVFKNAYHAEGSLTVSGMKQLEGREFKAGDEFIFELLRDQQVVDTAVVKSESGSSAGFTLQDDSLDETDTQMTYTYEVREVKGGQTASGVTYDNRIYRAEYKVEDNGDGTVTAKPVNGDVLDHVTFTNVYRTGEAAFTVSGIKHMTGRNFRTGDAFTFIAEKDGQPYDTVTIRPDSGNNQNFSFKADQYTMADAGKTYVYTVSEEKGSASRVTYSTEVYKIFVSIVDDGNGGLNVTAISNGTAFTNAEFVNTYREPSGGGDTSGGGSGGNTPNSNRPFAPGGPGDSTVTIDPGAVPLANVPEGNPSDNLILIDDGNVPLAGLPKTGDRAGHAGLATILSAILLAAFTALNNRKKQEENK